MLVLGIETSCDETAAAVVCDDRTIRSNMVYSQLKEHRAFGGVVPEIAARAHLDILDGIVRSALVNANVSLSDIDAVAATGGPGLIGGIIVGTMTAKAIALAANKPYIAVNHLEGHALTARLTDNLGFPYLLLLASGGHCQLVSVSGPGAYKQLGTTLDDAIGEAFDKSSKMMGLGSPGGPAIERVAAAGNPKRYEFPRPMKGRPGCDFSFSGLKTSVRKAILETSSDTLGRVDAQDIAASFQAAVTETVVDRCTNALAVFDEQHPDGKTLVVAGGVAANKLLREKLSGLCALTGFRFVAPPPSLCTDNAAMIAWVGIERLRLGLINDMDFSPRPRWPLEELI
ncbi:MAG: tRNA N6-adenosine threonylcarbamoyltransferase [Alphaproteobacteria bacterium MarineAlpha11_Bin1]|nr:MAG: tRNA N6-adenosine threonylcarbamoyltransferase [Alphaproteobacteria bacterium MarineAlpha11_Bin1]|tara:strand:+ start:2048 stop:3076 length:1029 start_codon:yes stop_codon:yes gene_type:complete